MQIPDIELHEIVPPFQVGWSHCQSELLLLHCWPEMHLRDNLT